MEAGLEGEETTMRPYWFSISLLQVPASLIAVALAILALGFAVLSPS